MSTKIAKEESTLSILNKELKELKVSLKVANGDLFKIKDYIRLQFPIGEDPYRLNTLSSEGVVRYINDTTFRLHELGIANSILQKQSSSYLCILTNYLTYEKELSTE